MEPEKTNEETSTIETVINSSTSSEQAKSEANDISGPKTFAILGYIIPFLFFLPLLDEKTKNLPFTRFHANQQILILVIYLAVQFISGMLYSALGGLTYLVLNVINLALLALVIIGAMNAYKGLMKELPVIGHFKLLK